MNGATLARTALLVAGLVCVLTGLLPLSEAEGALRRIAPLLLFLASVIVLTTLARDALVFDVIATRLAIFGGGRYPALFVLCVVFAASTTMLLNLDTTAVLLTPVLLALAARAEIAPLPLAMTTVWLSNTASLLLPVSNLTNLLAADRVALTAPAFAARMALPQLAAVLTTAAALWVFHWRRGRRGAARYWPPEPVDLSGPGRRLLFRVTGGACLLFVAAVPMVGDRIGLAALAAAGVAVLAFAVLDRARLTPALVPWQLLVLVTGLFLVVPTLSRHGLGRLTGALLGADPGAAGVLRAAATGAALSNLLNNLPAYAVGEAAVPVGHPDALLGLLIGTNVGAIVTPWASLATLLCLEACRSHALRVPLRRLVGTGLALALAAVPAGAAAVLLTG